MSHDFLVAAHIAIACTALAAGFGALRFPNGTLTHRRIGIVYLIAWTLLALTVAVNTSSDKPVRLGAFHACTLVGLAATAIAYGCVRFRKRLGKRWLRLHYGWMLLSVAALLGPTTNQVLWHLGVDYPKWVFNSIILSPLLLARLYYMRLSQPVRSWQWPVRRIFGIIGRRGEKVV